jgi:pyruvate dehydrogenase E1 component beta subunit
MDFMLLAVDQIVNQAAKWFHMLGGQEPCPVTIRAIINRGGEQGAQHSQALHSWFAHIPGLRVVMPATVQDARDLLIASVRCDDPVLYVDDRWLYELRADLPPVTPIPLESVRPELLRSGKDVTVVGAGYSTQLGIEAAELLAERGIGASVIDLRVINPLDCDLICDSVRSTRRLCAIDGGWRTCGLAGEIVARVSEKLPPGLLAAPPLRMTLPDAPAPTSKPLETAYYPTASRLAEAVESLFAGQRRNRS